MTEQDKVMVLSVVSLVDVQIIDGGDTLAIRFLKSNDKDLFILIPRQVASDLQPKVSDALNQAHNFGRLAR